MTSGYAEDTFDLILELLTVFCVTSCRGGNETQAVDGMLGDHTGEFPSGRIGAFQRFVGKTMGLVHILAEADHTQDARHHLMHAIGTTRAIFSRMEFVPHQCRRRLRIPCSLPSPRIPLVRMNGPFAVAHLLINRPVCNGRRSDRTRPDTFQHQIANRVGTRSHNQGLDQQSVQALDAHWHAAGRRPSICPSLSPRRPASSWRECQIQVMGPLICGLELLVRGQHVVVLLHHAGGPDMGGGL